MSKQAHFDQQLPRTAFMDGQINHLIVKSRTGDSTTHSGTIVPKINDLQ